MNATVKILGRYRGIGPNVLEQIETALDANGLVIVPTSATRLDVLFDLIHEAGFVVCKRLTKRERDSLWKETLHHSANEKVEAPK